MYPLRCTRTLPQGCTIVSWLLFLCRHISSLPWSVTVWTCFLELRECSWSLECVPYKQEMGDTWRHLCSGTPQGPAQFQKCLPLKRLQGKNEPLGLHEGWCLWKKNAHHPSFHSPRKRILTATSWTGPSDLGSCPLTCSISSPQPHPPGLPSVLENFMEAHLAPQPNGLRT